MPKLISWVFRSKSNKCHDMIDRIIDVFHIVSEIDNPQKLPRYGPTLFGPLVQYSGWITRHPSIRLIWYTHRILTPGPQRHPLNTGIVWETGMCHKNRMEVTTRG